MNAEMDFSAATCRARVAELPPYLTEVLRRMAEGKPTKQIAAELNITESTARVYRERVYSKVGATSIAVATRVALGAGLL